jgi:hypothetical protein
VAQAPTAGLLRVEGAGVSVSVPTLDHLAPPGGTQPPPAAAAHQLNPAGYHPPRMTWSTAYHAHGSEHQSCSPRGVL